MIVCVGCGNQITGRLKSAIYCCRGCRQRARYRRAHPLPLMKNSHRPQLGPRPCDELFRRMHASMREHYPCKTPADWPDRIYPYGVWVCEDSEEVMFSRGYAPMWRRYPGQPATRDNPSRWVKWRMMYALHDDKPTPEHSKRLRETLQVIVEEFKSGGPLYVRDWEGRRHVPRWAGELIARVRMPPAPPLLRIVRDDSNPEDANE